MASNNELSNYTAYSDSDDEDGEIPLELEVDGENIEELDMLDREQLCDYEELGATLIMLQDEQIDHEWCNLEKVSSLSAFMPDSEDKPGPTFDEPLQKANEYFQLFFDEELLERVVYLTNKNAHTRKDGGEKGPWYNLTVTELKAYIGVWIVIESTFKDRLEEIWSTNNTSFLSSTPGIPKVFTRDRYSQITRYLHFCDESIAVPIGDYDYDPLFKVRFLIEHLKKKFQENYIPHQEVSVDECMVPFRGRLAFKQYIKDKPIKWGIKVYMLADSTNGYNFNFEVYTGKDSCYGNVVSLGLGERTVLSLTKPLHGMGYHVYFDRFFTSPSLLHHLSQLSLHGCGTIMAHRIGFPSVLKRQPHDMHRGEFEWLKCDKTSMVATVWQDKKPIYFLSNIHIPEKDGLKISRGDGRGNKVQVSAPPTVVEYNQFMGGVDLNDKMTSLDKSRRTYKWYRRLYRKGIMWSLYNAYILEGFFVDHNPKNKRKRDFRTFYMEVAHELVGSFERKNPTFTGHNITRINRLSSEDHFPIVGEGRDHSCVVCGQRFLKYVKAHPDVHYSEVPPDYKRKKTIFKCSSGHCDVYLCIKNNSICWQKWHQNIEYWR